MNTGCTLLVQAVALAHPLSANHFVSGNTIMLKFTAFALPIALIALSSAAFAADTQTIDLKDGGKIVVAADKTMTHTDSAGKRVRMKDGKMMEAKDGSMLMMKSNALWKTIAERGTLNPNR